MLKIWQQLQALEWTKYQRDSATTFSLPGQKVAEYIGRNIAGECSNCLDIGCGALPKPGYMSNDSWVGIDPFYGDQAREFLFAQAVGESIPFKDATFDCASFISTLDHMINPANALVEACRVLRRGGLLFVWTICRVFSDARYVRWLAEGGLFDDYHQWAFDDASLRQLVIDAGFEVRSLMVMQDEMSTRLLEAVKL